MIAALLEMRFGDEEVKKCVERADTNRKKALAWQFFASRLSEHLNVVVNSDQVSNKYKKLKCEYRQGKNSRSQTGNDGREDDTELWGILNSAFAGRTGIGGTTLADANNVSESDDDLSFASPENRQKSTTPIASLAEAMKDGMTALAASLGSDNKLADVLIELRASQAATRDLQTRQLLVLEQLVTKMSSTD